MTFLNAIEMNAGHSVFISTSFKNAFTVKCWKLAEQNSNVLDNGHIFTNKAKKYFPSKNKDFKKLHYILNLIRYKLVTNL